MFSGGRPSRLRITQPKSSQEAIIDASCSGSGLEGKIIPMIVSTCSGCIGTLLDLKPSSSVVGPFCREPGQWQYRSGCRGRLRCTWILIAESSKMVIPTGSHGLNGELKFLPGCKISMSRSFLSQKFHMSNWMKFQDFFPGKWYGWCSASWARTWPLCLLKSHLSGFGMCLLEKKNICPQVLGNATKEIECHPRRLLIGSLGETCLVSLTEKEYRLVLPFALHTN